MSGVREHLEEEGLKGVKSVLKTFKQGQPIELPDGSVLRPEEHMERPTARKIAILSDSRDSSAAAVLTSATPDAAARSFSYVVSGAASLAP